MEKQRYLKDGKVGVLYSPGFGAGWYTWNTDYPDCVFEPDIVRAVLDKDFEKVKLIVGKLYGKGFYTGGAEDLQVKWLDPGDQFEIKEYDGSETIHIIGHREYLEA